MRGFIHLGVIGATALCLTFAGDADAGGRGRGKMGRDGIDADRRTRQGPRLSQAQREQRQAQLVETLGLTQDQQTQWEQLREAGQAAMEDLRSSGDASREDVDALRASHREAFEAILTPAQITALQQLHNDRPRPERGQRQGARLGPGRQGPEEAAARRAARREAVAQALGLSPQQQAQLDALRQTHHEARELLRADGRPDREAVEALRAQHRADLATILTTAQLATLEQLHEQRGPHRRGGIPGVQAAGDSQAEIGEGAGKAAVANSAWADVKLQSR